MEYEALRAVFRRVNKAVGGPLLSMHDLRHTPRCDSRDEP